MITDVSPTYGQMSKLIVGHRWVMGLGLGCRSRGSILNWSDQSQKPHIRYHSLGKGRSKQRGSWPEIICKKVLPPPPFSLWIYWPFRWSKSLERCLSLFAASYYRGFQRNRYISSIPLWQTMPGVKWTNCCLKHYRGISFPIGSLGPFQAASDTLWQSLKQILTLFTSYSVLWAL